MTLSQIFALVQQVLSAVLTTLGIVQSLDRVQAAQENVPFTIETTLAILDSYSRNAPTGFPAVLDAIALVRLDTASPHLATLTDVLDAIAAAPLVTLPTDPPPTWSIAFGVGTWLYSVDVPSMCPID